jgi:tetratricopeptide (TPR) repeat protein
MLQSTPPNLRNTDRNLLFGALAVQADLLPPRRFVEACSLWANRSEKPLADLLVQRGWLTAEACQEIETLLQRKLDKHHGDVQAALAEVGGNGLYRAFASVREPELRTALIGLGQSVQIGLTPPMRVPPVRPAPPVETAALAWDVDEKLPLRSPKGGGVRQWARSNRRLVQTFAALAVAAVIACVLCAGLFVRETLQQEKLARTQKQRVQMGMPPKAGPFFVPPAELDQDAEAQQLVDYLYLVLVNRSAVVEHIRRDPVLDGLVRPSLARHLILPTGCCDSLTVLASQAGDIVQILDRDIRTKAIQIAQRQDKNYLEVLREALRQEDPLHQGRGGTYLVFNNASWYVVRQPGAPAASYHKALALAEEAVRLIPPLDDQPGIVWNTLGVAQYRAGKYAEAAKWLDKSDRQNRHKRRVPLIADLAFLAMALQKSGEKEKAQEVFEQLRQAPLTVDTVEHELEDRVFLREVEEVFGKKLKRDDRAPRVGGLKRVK